MSDFDLIVIGAGIHGAGVAQAAAAAGCSVLVLEKNTVGSGTSSKSSKLIHGGLRYLESYQFTLVRKSLKERALLSRLAPGLVKLQPFYIPVYKSTSRRPLHIRFGLSLYAILGGLHKDNLFKCITKKKVEKLDGLKKTELEKVYRYYDGQTNDTRLTQAVMDSAMQLGVKLICSAKVESIIKNEKGFSVHYKDKLSQDYAQAKVVVNATGPWVNELHNKITPEPVSLDIELVQGTHIILNVSAPTGIYYLEAHDKRAVFVMPHEFEGEMKTMVGTTEKLFQGKADDVNATEEEVDYLVKIYKTYFPEKMNVSVIEQFAGLRVLPKDEGSMFSRARDTTLHWALPGLLTLYGGKLTAYRSTSELVLNKIKPLLDKRRRVAYTEQLYLTNKS